MNQENFVCEVRKCNRIYFSDAVAICSGDVVYFSRCGAIEMNLVDGYGSDSEGETISSEVACVPKEALPPSNTHQQPVRRKVKRLDISFLPTEIQAALTRGDSTNDSDDEGVGLGVQSLRSVSKDIPGGSNSGSKSKLLGMLPAPKSKDDTKPTEVPVKPIVNHTDEQPASKSSFVFGFTSTSTSRTAKASNEGNFNAGIGEDTTAPVKSDEESDIQQLPWMQSIKSKSQVRFIPALMQLADYDFRPPFNW